VSFAGGSPLMKAQPTASAKAKRYRILVARATVANQLSVIAGAWPHKGFFTQTN
jgi:hypothetical protein